mmetsp:Transcript_29205/g.96944  ORF Transcript_29205/g.96944 Transcript_29205/m.96944 type:complete len:171 (+) Transcript_29205:323-835(+)
MVNAHSFGGGTTGQQALFEHISLAPHSCSNNAVYASVKELGLSRLVATRDIMQGDIVAINYIPISCDSGAGSSSESFEASLHLTFCVSVAQPNLALNPQHCRKRFYMGTRSSMQLTLTHVASTSYPSSTCYTVSKLQALMMARFTCGTHWNSCASSVLGIWSKTHSVINI